jgi:hypothetical protein
MDEPTVSLREACKGPIYDRDGGYRDGGYRNGGYEFYRNRDFHRHDRRWERDRYDGHRYSERWDYRDR